jgi:hypothetical protein
MFHIQKSVAQIKAPLKNCSGYSGHHFKTATHLVIPQKSYFLNINHKSMNITNCEKIFQFL